MKLEIEWLSDEHDCENCGSSYAEGASVTLDDKPFLLLAPAAYCFDGASWNEEEVYKAILEKLGYTISFGSSRL
jgi:hypothetical protein